MTLSGANITYTGTTNVNGGTLGLQDTTAFGSAINVGTAGMLKLVRTSAGFGSRSSIAGNNIGGSGVINVNNAANTAGNTNGGWATVSGGTLELLRHDQRELGRFRHRRAVNRHRHVHGQRRRRHRPGYPR